MSHVPSAHVDEVVVKAGVEFPMAWEDRVVAVRYDAVKKTYTLVVVRRG
jgi:hypothetical protein